MAIEELKEKLVGKRLICERVEGEICVETHNDVIADLELNDENSVSVRFKESYSACYIFENEELERILKDGKFDICEVHYPHRWRLEHIAERLRREIEEAFVGKCFRRRYHKLNGDNGNLMEFIVGRLEFDNGLVTLVEDSNCPISFTLMLDTAIALADDGVVEDKSDVLGKGIKCSYELMEDDN